MHFEYDPDKSISNSSKHGIDERLYTAIFTERDDKVRLISVRRARKEEIELYEQNKQR